MHEGGIEWRHLHTTIANHAGYTFWYVIPPLPMFLAFPALMTRICFWPAPAASALLTTVCFALLVRRFGIELM